MSIKMETTNNSRTRDRHALISLEIRMSNWRPGRLIVDCFNSLAASYWGQGSHHMTIRCKTCVSRWRLLQGGTELLVATSNLLASSHMQISHYRTCFSRLRLTIEALDTASRTREMWRTDGVSWLGTPNWHHSNVLGHKYWRGWKRDTVVRLELKFVSLAKKLNLLVFDINEGDI